jgi:hypothetical protein
MSKKKPRATEFAESSETNILDGAHVECSPEERGLQEWLRIGRVKGKFDRWWHQKVADAKTWGLAVDPIYETLAALLDEVFPGTHNSFDFATAVSVPPVVWEDLRRFFKTHHGYSFEKTGQLTLRELAEILRKDAADNITFGGTAKIFPITVDSRVVEPAGTPAKDAKPDASECREGGVASGQLLTAAYVAHLLEVNESTVNRNIPVSLRKKDGKRFLFPWAMVVKVANSMGKKLD